MLVLLNASRYFFGININATIKRLFSREPEIDFTIVNKSGKPISGDDDDDDDDNNRNGLMEKKQVFNVPGNKYSYDDAKALCQAYDGDLASYNQIESAYKNGGEWCNYGWSKNQMVLFPTQKNTWQKLQAKKGHKHNCGRPGINGGYIDNPQARFGVNCFGYKPDITSAESKMMKEFNLFPKTQEDIEYDKRVDEMRKEIPNIYRISFITISSYFDIPFQ